MFKKTMLIGLLFMLLAGLVSAEITRSSSTSTASSTTTTTSPTVTQQAVQTATAPSTASSTSTTTSPTVTQQAVQTQPSNTIETPSTPDLLLIDLEIKRVDRAHSWVNVYLTSGQGQIFTISPIRLVSSSAETGKFVKAEMHSPFDKVSSQINGDGSVITIFGPGPFLMTPSAKTYLGRIYLENSNAQPGTAAITLDSASSVFYPSSVPNAMPIKFVLSMTPLSACTPDTDLGVAVGSNVDCGALDDGCGGIVNFGSCGESRVCVNNVCQSAVSLVLPSTAPAHDKTILEQVSKAVSDKTLTKLQKLALIVNAVKAWLAAQ